MTVRSWRSCLVVLSRRRGSKVFVSAAPWEETQAYSLVGSDLIAGEVYAGDSALWCSTGVYGQDGKMKQEIARDSTSGSLWLLDGLDEAGQPLAERELVRTDSSGASEVFCDASEWRQCEGELCWSGTPHCAD